MKLQRKRPYAYRGKRRITWWKALAALVLAGILVFAGLFGAVMYGSYDHIQDDPQVMVILGCRVMPEGHPSILLQDRLDTALDYWEEHQDITIVTSGGQGSNEPTSEARCMADYLMEGGVPEDQILLEDQSHNTKENFLYSKELLADEGIDVGETDVLVVSNGFHLTRARMLAERFGYGEVSTLAAPPHTSRPGFKCTSGSRWLWSSPSSWIGEWFSFVGEFRRFGGEVLSQRWERTQRIAGDAADGHFVPIGPLTPDPIFTGAPIRRAFRLTQRRGWLS